VEDLVRNVLIWFGVVAVTVSLAAQAVNLKPGRYEATVEMELAGSPTKMPPIKDTQCLTAEDLKDLSNFLAGSDEPEQCKISDYRNVGNKVTFNATCAEDGRSYSMNVELMFSGESFTGLMKSTDKGKEMTIRTVAKRIGDCVK
jgi:hypothetical protein